MEKEDRVREPEDEIGSTEEQKQQYEGQNGNGELKIVKFLDSLDSYVTLFDSLSLTLRQGWLELASARHSMGASRVNTTLFDLNSHSAATSVRVTEEDVDSTMKQSKFTLHKWVSHDNRECSCDEAKIGENELFQSKSINSELRYRGTSEIQENVPGSNGSTFAVDDQIQKERSKSISTFGTLVSPKLRTAQLSFETALDTLVEIANTRSSMLYAYDQVRKDIENTKG